VSTNLVRKALLFLKKEIVKQPSASVNPSYQQVSREIRFLLETYLTTEDLRFATLTLKAT